MKTVSPNRRFVFYHKMKNSNRKNNEINQPTLKILGPDTSP